MQLRSVTWSRDQLVHHLSPVCRLFTGLPDSQPDHIDRVEIRAETEAADY
jgi:hypothetical protein